MVNGRADAKPTEPNHAADEAIDHDPKVLLVEDEGLLLMDIASTFEQSGFAVECATNTKQALSLVGQQSFDAAVLDGWLGFEWSEDISRELDRRGIPYLIYSGHPLSSLKWAHPQGFLDKPIGPEQLVSEITKLIGSRLHAS
jgi:DNA-binding response OmpR family regulator